MVMYNCQLVGRYDCRLIVRCNWKLTDGIRLLIDGISMTTVRLKCYNRSLTGSYSCCLLVRYNCNVVVRHNGRYKERYNCRLSVQV